MDFTGTIFRGAVGPDCHHIVYTNLFIQMMGFIQAYYSTSEAGGWVAELYFFFYQEGTVLAWLQQFTISLEHGPRAGISAETGQWQLGLVLLLELLWLNHISQKSYQDTGYFFNIYSLCQNIEDYAISWYVWVEISSHPLLQTSLNTAISTTFESGLAFSEILQPQQAGEEKMNLSLPTQRKAAV